MAFGIGYILRMVCTLEILNEGFDLMHIIIVALKRAVNRNNPSRYAAGKQSVIPLSLTPQFSPYHDNPVYSQASKL
jgi:hypothetical protein